jgi:rhodanese-related sulfurtransferase
VAELTRRFHVPSAVRPSPARIDAVKAKALLERGSDLVDVRRHDDPAVTVEGALRIAPDELPARLHELPKGVPIVLVCG